MGFLQHAAQAAAHGAGFRRIPFRGTPCKIREFAGFKQSREHCRMPGFFKEIRT
jgi:hypothetical protein